MNLLSRFQKKQNIVLLMCMFLFLCSVIAGCSGVSSSAASSQDCRFRINGTLIPDMSGQLLFLSGTYVKTGDPSSRIVFNPDCQVTFKSKKYYYQTKAFEIWLSSNGDAASNYRDAILLRVHDEGKYIAYESEIYTKV